MCPYLDSLRGKSIFAQFYDPDAERHSLPTYPYRWAPKGLYTIRQLRAMGLRPGGQDIAAQILWRHRRHTRVAYLYREDLAKPKRTATPTRRLASWLSNTTTTRSCLPDERALTWARNSSLKAGPRTG